MIHLDNTAVRERLPWSALIEAIARSVIENIAMPPPRTTYEVKGADGAVGHLLIMPAWMRADIVGLKVVTYWPKRAPSEGPPLGASYLLIDMQSGAVMATLAAEELTARRTAAVSVIAAKRLMRAGARRLLVIGAGPVARNLVSAYAALHPFERIELFGRDSTKASAVIAELAHEGIACDLSESLEKSVELADVISFATSAIQPLIRGEWVSPGTHIDLVGSFTPAMREIDDALIRRVSAIWVDTDVALTESGDLCQPLADGVIERSTIKGDLQKLLTADVNRFETDITIFKSVGFALPDLAAAKLALGQFNGTCA